MFEDAPEAAQPDPVISNNYFNSNILNYIKAVLDLAYAFMLYQVVLSSERSVSLAAVTLLTYSVFGVLAFYASSVVLNNFNTKSILDFRGLFLAIHQYHWCVKYSFVLYLCLLALMLVKQYDLLTHTLVLSPPHKSSLIGVTAGIGVLTFLFLRALRI